MPLNYKKHLYIILAVFLCLLSINIYFWQKNQAQTKNTAREAVEAEEPVLLDLKINENDFVLGTFVDEAKVDLVVYDDPLAEFTSEYFERLNFLEEKYGDDINIAYRFNDVGLYNESDYYSEVIVCAGLQGRFYEVFKEVLGAKERGALRRPYPMGLSSVYPIDIDKWNDCLEGEEAKLTLAGWKQEAEDNLLIGVPNSVINGVYYPGSYPLEDFVDRDGDKRKGLLSIIDEELSKN